jgi:hypothetical protein
MLDFQAKINNSAGAAGHLTAEEFNNFIHELENLVKAGKLTLSPLLTEVLQIAQSVAIAARSAGIFIDSGAANTVRLTPHAGAGTYPLPPNFTVGRQCGFVPSAGGQ